MSVKSPIINHLDVNDLFKRMKLEPNGDMPGEDLVVVVRPRMRFTDTAKFLLEKRGIEIIRDAAAPIDSMYLLDRKTYDKYKLTDKNNV